MGSFWKNEPIWRGFMTGLNTTEKGMNQESVTFERAMWIPTVKRSARSGDGQTTCGRTAVEARIFLKSDSNAGFVLGADGCKRVSQASTDLL